MRIAPSHLLDLMPLAIASLLLVGAAFCQFHLWPVALGRLADGPEVFAAGFASVTQRAEMILMPLGFSTAIATFVVLMRATAATGMSRGLVSFVIFQLIATIFLVTELALAQVVIAEEFPAESRGRELDDV